MRGWRIMLLVSAPIVVIFVVLLTIFFATGGGDIARNRERSPTCTNVERTLSATETPSPCR